VVSSMRKRSLGNHIALAILIASLSAMSLNELTAQNKASTASIKPGVTKETPFINTLGMHFVPVPGTRVLFSIWETRVQDYAAFIESSPSIPKGPGLAKPTHPITNVSWEDAAAFCQWLTAHERKLGKIGAKERYRLPTDLEWTQAAGPTKYPWGDKWPPPKNANGKTNFAFVPEGQENTAPVGSYPANALGIFDLAGNAFEWVYDWYRKEMNPRDVLQENERLRDDEGGQKYKVLRGAPWIFHEPSNLLCAYHYINTPTAHGPLYGFRCVLEVTP
jgi:formylglycine-generating enzyme required for sulfatase activity